MLLFIKLTYFLFQFRLVPLTWNLQSTIFLQQQGKFFVDMCMWNVQATMLPGMLINLSWLLFVNTQTQKVPLQCNSWCNLFYNAHSYTHAFIFALYTINILLLLILLSSVLFWADWSTHVKTPLKNKKHLQTFHHPSYR